MPVHIATPFWLHGGLLHRCISYCHGGLLAVSQDGAIKKKQRLKSEYEKKLANVEMSALLAQMNPHFLFNSLNSIDSYIIRNESKKASEYLNNFARLMRLILQNSRSNYINLKDELEALELYMQMESLRFKNKFCYSIAIDENVESSSIVIPPMLIQPYVENAIWHGLMHKTNGTEGLVKINISKNADDLLCVIEDNGIGRKKRRN
jgi:LytS/YehU family sensor histidine kinase